MFNVSKEQCCSINTGPGTGWSPHSAPSSGLLFFWEFLSNGAPAGQRCHNSCENVVCPNPRTCRMKKLIPKCVCKTKCSRKDDKRPVCGTDLQKYKSTCHLRRHNCKYNTDIRVDYIGKCKDSCRNVKCPTGRFCVEDQNGLPHCINCSTNCAPAPKAPVCGTNFKTYDSACHLRASLCGTKSTMQIAYSGVCQANATCLTISCPYHMKCLVNPVTRQPTCTNCRRQCSPLSVVPVCGTDGISYKNYCVMRRRSCEMRVLIQTKHSGHCHKKGKARGCRGCKKHLKKLLRRRKNKRKKLRSKSTRENRFSRFKTKYMEAILYTQIQNPRPKGAA